MEINQIASMIEWIDEERRRDKSTILALEERLAQQLDLVDQMQRRLKGVESDQSVMKHETMSAQKGAEIVEHVRLEMLQMLENAEARRLTAEREAERRSELQRDSFQRSLREVTEKSGPIGATAVEHWRLAKRGRSPHQRHARAESGD